MSLRVILIRHLSYSGPTQMLLVFGSVKSALLDHGNYAIRIFLLQRCNIKCNFPKSPCKIRFVFLSPYTNGLFFSLPALPVSLQHIVHPTSLPLQHVHFISLQNAVYLSSFTLQRTVSLSSLFWKHTVYTSTLTLQHALNLISLSFLQHGSCLFFLLLATYR